MVKVKLKKIARSQLFIAEEKGYVSAAIRNTCLLMNAELHKHNSDYAGMIDSGFDCQNGHMIASQSCQLPNITRDQGAVYDRTVTVLGLCSESQVLIS